MKKTCICALPNLAEKPLPTKVVDHTITINCKNGWDGHAFGAVIGYLDEENKPHSCIKSDKENNSTELFDQMRKDYELIEKPTTICVDAALQHVLTYAVPFQVKDHIAYKPTCETFVDNATNVDYDLTYVITFAADDTYVRYLPISYKTGGCGAMPLFEHISSLPEILEEYIEAETHGFQASEEDDSFTLTFYNNIGESADIEFQNIDELLRLIAAIRLVECKETIYD